MRLSCTFVAMIAAVAAHTVLGRGTVLIIVVAITVAIVIVAVAVAILRRPVSVAIVSITVRLCITVA